MQKTLLGLSAALLCVPVSAQLATNATLANMPAPNPNFSPTALMIGECGQLELRPDAAAGANMYRVTATVSGGAMLPNGSAPVGGWDAMEAMYDSSTQTFSNHDYGSMASVNTATDEFQASQSLDLTVLVTDSGNGAAVIASRASAALGTPFGAPQTIAGVPTGYIDPHLARIDGVYKLLWVDGPGNIAIGDIDINPSSASFGTVTNQAIASTAQNNFNHSPMVTYTAAGEAIATVHSNYIAGGGSDSWYLHWTGAEHSGDLPQHMWGDARGSSLGISNWLANPASIGGQTYWANASGTYIDMMDIQVIGTGTGQAVSAAAGGTARAALVSPPSSSPTDLGIVILGTPLPSPLPIFAGAPLQVTTVVTQFGPLDANGCFTVNAPIPPGFPATGDVAAQAGLFQPATNTITLAEPGTVHITP